MKKQAIAATQTLGKVFVGAALGQIIVGGVGVLDLDGAGWKNVAAAGLGAVIVTAYNWLNPKDDRYGVGSEQ